MANGSRIRATYALATVLSSIVAMCSCATSDYRYQSLRDGSCEKLLTSRQLWAVDLPYKSGKDLVIESTAGDELVLSDNQGGFHVTKIPVAADGQPKKPLNAKFSHGDSLEILDNGEILVTGWATKKSKVVALLDRRDLSSRISTELPFSEATDITTSGSKLVGDTLLVFQSAVHLERESWSDHVYEYELPYVASSSYDIHVLDIRTRAVNSFSRSSRVCGNPWRAVRRLSYRRHGYDCLLCARPNKRL